MLQPSITSRIIALKNADLELRDKLIQTGELFEGYNADMEALHLKNAKALEAIIDEIGYPTVDLVGVDGSEAAWLIIQHSISRPDFMKKCQSMLKSAVAAGQASPINLAYLTDRIAVLSGVPQIYGTQYDWDQYGQLSPLPYDHLPLVEQRRKEVGLKPLKDQTLLMRKQAEVNHESPPPDYHERKSQADAWRKSVGWII